MASPSSPSSDNVVEMYEVDPETFATMQSLFFRKTQESDPFMKEIQKSPNTWARTLNSLQELRYNLINLDFYRQLIVSMPPVKFSIAFLTPNMMRDQLLFHMLKRVCSDDDFWSNTTKFEVLRKYEWACKQWGISMDRDKIRGGCGAKENLIFWKEVMSVVQRLSQVPEKSKIMLQTDFTQNEEHLSWEAVFANAMKQVTEKKTHRIQYCDVENAETLHKNKMTDTTFTDSLKKAVADTFNNHHIIHKAETCLKKDHKNCEALEKIGKTLSQKSLDYGMFMSSNDLFIRNKTEFVIFYSKSGIKIMNEILFQHRQFLKALTDFMTEDDDEVNFWIH